MLGRGGRARDAAIARGPAVMPPPAGGRAAGGEDIVLSSGRIVDDFAVAGDYPEAASATLRRIRFTGGIDEGAGILGVLPVDGAIVKRHWVADPARGYLFGNHDYIPELNPWPGTDARHYAMAVAPSDIVPLAGRVIVVGGAWDRNYYHWLLNWLPRLSIVKMLAPHLWGDPSVRILIDEHNARPPFTDFLALLEVDPARIVWASPHTTFRIDQALAVSFTLDYFPDVIAALAADLKRTLPPPPPGAPKRIWIDRQGIGQPKRRVANFEEILPVLQAHGFAPVRLETLAPAEQIALFASADAVAGVNGAGFANMIFSPPGCRIMCIEKLWSRRLRLDAMFSGLAVACGLDWELLHARSQREPGMGFTEHPERRHNQDFRVDPEALGRALERAVRR